MIASRPAAQPRGVDLHLHTTASDGRSSPSELVEQAVAAGVATVAVTDHDTVAALAEVASLCATAGLQTVSGIEITAVENGRDVHVLGYFFDPTHPGLLTFLRAQRTQRLDRISAIGNRLASLGMPTDLSALVARATSGASVGRPLIARAMIEAGHVVSVSEAFELWLATGRPAFVSRAGAPSMEVIRVIHEAGGLASLAHPLKTAIDPMIPALGDAGLDAIEVYHTDHPPTERERYDRLARDLGLLVTGGSDYHGDPEQGRTIGAATLPDEEWERLRSWQPRS